jgi:cytochrome c peroxidase
MNNCASCHSQNFGRPVKFYANNGLDAITLDKGVGGITGASSEQGTFKVPTLRNIAITAPYMHDGRFATLEDVVEHYSSGIKSHPNLASELKDGSQPKKFNFSSQEKSDLITFLGTLTDDVFKTDERFSNPFK